MKCLLSKFQPQHSYDFPDWILSLLAPSHVTPRHVQIERHSNTQRRGFMINPSKSDAGRMDNSPLTPYMLRRSHLRDNNESPKLARPPFVLNFPAPKIGSTTADKYVDARPISHGLLLEWLAPSNLILRHHNSPSPRNGCNDSGARVIRAKRFRRASPALV